MLSLHQVLAPVSLGLSPITSAARLLSTRAGGVLASRGRRPYFTPAPVPQIFPKNFAAFSTDVASSSTLPQAHPSSTGTVPITSLPGTKADSAYALVFTCNKCNTRSAKKISKHSYHNGIVIVRCPGCEKLHLIADHFCWFGDEPQTIEDILREKGETVVKGTVEDATKADQAVVAAVIADAVGKKEAIELREGEVLPDVQIEGLDADSVRKLQLEIIRKQREQQSL
ncbi:conserved hypothetical protein [Perkinsus marinus ATCC 50983]|uniref:DNL-type domain-containing protein n=1 Tax=Perkinsus marinus (strain ATCC 50983 / TXsc) TaxID=423536 RepID=C5KAG8_PERM5|nr:conserved hypothetical protein [Perkinsus marinus ATCC 50983]EER18504.1 conserved hypothetical protein [Perkinsus marinus ATCC 50983]|eukprot:XP_002786708.1 conserved hypothetical protein [Perkinsus marinus ATCC 50983]